MHWFHHLPDCAVYGPLPKLRWDEKKGLLKVIVLVTLVCINIKNKDPYASYDSQGFIHKSLPQKSESLPSIFLILFYSHPDQLLKPFTSVLESMFTHTSGHFSLKESDYLVTAHCFPHWNDVPHVLLHHLFAEL